jgi:hypothetical protein
MESQNKITSFWETKYLSAEKSIEFLQIEHAQTLKYLHDQIEDLQKKCGGMKTFRQLSEL